MILLVSVCSDEQSRCVSHSEQLNRKCSTVSVACPQAHWSDSTIPILCRYPLNCAMPVRSCASTLASVRPKVSYRVRVCRPGNAVSIFFRFFPTPFWENLVILPLWSCHVDDRGFGPTELFLWESACFSSPPCWLVVGCKLCGTMSPPANSQGQELNSI